MRRYFLLLVISVFSFWAGAQTGKVINDPNASPRTVDAFHAIQIADGIDLYLSQGNEEKVVVSASKEEYRKEIVTRVENGVLRIYYADNKVGIYWKDRKMKAYVSAKNIDELKASGGSDIFLEGTLGAGKLNLELSGGSDFTGSVKTTELSIEITGGSDAHLRGSATNLKVEARGGSDFIGYDLETEYAIIKAGGGSDAKLNVRKELYAEATGGSDVYYKGNPVIKQSSSSGGGSISRRD